MIDVPLGEDGNDCTCTGESWLPSLAYFEARNAGRVELRNLRRSGDIPETFRHLSDAELAMVRRVAWRLARRDDDVEAFAGIQLAREVRAEQRGRRYAR